MYENGKIYLGLSGEERVYMNLSMANRHGLVAGASGTGKTVTMKVLAEAFSDAGVPVFLCDIKGDVSGLCMPGEANENMEKRIDKFGIRDTFKYDAYPVSFWDVYQQNGHPVRVTVSDMGPDLLSRVLGLSPAQEGVLNIVFRIADDSNLMLIDLKDLRALLSYVGDHRTDFLNTYGAIAPQSLGAILRALLPLEEQGGDLFFGEPALDINDWIRCSSSGKGIINLLDCVKLVRSPTLYASFLLWMLSSLFEELPEAGDMEKPKLVFFFDEAHLMFADTPKALVQKIEQVVKLIRSKGVGVYFVTQSPSDIPDPVLAQLSNRIQHALRAYTPAEQKAVKTAANSLRANPDVDAEKVITEMGVGEALVSLLDENGVPGMVKQTAIICPQSLMAEATMELRRVCIATDGMTKYDTSVDNESAYEVLAEQAAQAEEEARKAAEEAQRQKEEEERRKQEEKEEAARRKQLEKEEAALQKKKEKEEAAQQRKKEKEEEAKKKAADRRKARIEQQVISTGASILRRGIMNTLKKKW